MGKKSGKGRSKIQVRGKTGNFIFSQGTSEKMKKKKQGKVRDFKKFKVDG